MSKRNYAHVQNLLPKVHQMVAQGMCYREIAEHYGLKNSKVINNLVYRENKKTIQSIPKQRDRKSPVTLAEYKYENKRLKMEIELLRDFLQSTERM